nr:putative fatty acid elongation protein 3 [Quercus suber]
MSRPRVYLSWPSGFSFFPEDLARPHPLPPPIKERSLRSPFGIEKSLYFNALRWQIPITFAAVYILTVLYFNGVNRRRKNQPWSIAYKKSFRNFVVGHNILLAIYSFATFLAMARAFAHIWPGLDSDTGAAGIADALCKLHGPRGLGDAATYNATLNIFEVKNTLIRLGYDGNPDPTDVGRMWNEGLAFWGWLFYVSKFYEVIDTAIILAKGKRSPTLQTYHHAGAMLCMWAGMRYMSPPIMMFVFLNSFIHAWMYTYYALSALGYRVPRRYKQLLTTLQIAQFLFGASYAAAHLFVQYDIPVSTPYQIVDTVRKAVSSVSSAASAASTAASSLVESPLASASLGAMVKKLLLRAAGEEGVAERIHNDRGDLLTPHIAEKIEYFNEHTYHTRWRKDWTKVDCIDTSGEAFAIYLNIFYLTPLTWLFGRFFVRAYLSRGKPRTASDAAKQLGDSARDAARRTSDVVEKAGEKAGEKMVQGSEEAQKEGNAVRAQMREDLQKVKDGKFVNEKKTSQRMDSIKSTAQGVVEDFQKETQSLATSAQELTSKVASSAQEFASSLSSSTAQTVESAKTSAQTAAQDVQRSAPQTTKNIQDAAEAASQDIQKAVPEGKKQAQQSAETIAREIQKGAPEVQQKAQQAIDAASEEVQKGFPETKQKAQQAADAVESTLKGSDEGSGLLGGGLLSPKKERSSNTTTTTSTTTSSSSSSTTTTKAQTATSGPESEDKATQDAIIASSQPVRPGKGEEDADTDAMGKSGIAIEGAVKEGGEGENYPGDATGGK